MTTSSSSSSLGLPTSSIPSAAYSSANIYASVTSSSSSQTPNKIRSATYGAVAADREKLEFSDDDTEFLRAQDPIEDALQNCFDQVIRPVAFFLCFLGWRPFPLIAQHQGHPGYFVLDLLYPILVACFLGFGYFFGLYYSISVGRMPLVSEYLMEAVVSFCLWLYGLWFFRKEEGRAFEELSALIETVYLYSSNGHSKLSQDRLTQTLVSYLISAGYTLLFYLGFALWVGITLAVQLMQGSRISTGEFTLIILTIAIGYVAEHAVYVATIIIYWINCRLHMHYLDGIRDRLMKRSVSLGKATRDIASIKKLINDNSQGWGVAVSFLVFALAVEAVFIQVRFFEGEQYKFEFVQAGIAFVIALGLLFAALIPSSMVCWKAERLKSVSWKIRAEQHYRKATAEEIDSFLVFCSSSRMYAKILGFPIWKEYLFLLAGVICVTIFFLWRIGLYFSS